MFTLFTRELVSSINKENNQLTFRLLLVTDTDLKVENKNLTASSREVENEIRIILCELVQKKGIFQFLIPKK